MRTREQLSRILEFAGVGPDAAWTRQVGDDSFYDVILDKSIADMRSDDVGVKRTSTRTVAAYAEHIGRRPDVIAVLRQRCEDEDREVAGNAREVIRLVPVPFWVIKADWLERAPPALAAASEQPEQEIEKVFGKGQDQITCRVRKTRIGDTEVVVICANPGPRHVTVTFGERKGRTIGLRADGNQSIGVCTLYADECHEAEGADVKIEVHPESGTSLSPGGE
jgi:hypothetical protein